ncbi:MAG: aminopeptidase N [Trueperella sp.]|nr:aminopeptidase N [Trueperella sp.]
MSENLKRSEARERARAIAVDTQSISLDLSEAASDRSTFPVHTELVVQISEPITTFLDFLGESVAEVLVDDAAVEFTFDGARILLPELPAGAHRIVVTAHAKYSNTGEGLHRFRDTDGQVYLYSQFEPADARRVFPNFEQPNLKARFQTSITADAAWTVLSNGVEEANIVVGKNSLGAECTRREFAEMPPMSTYLVAFIAGPYVGFQDAIELTDPRTAEKYQVDLGFYCRAAMAEHFDLADISQVTKQGLQLFPQAFNCKYQWGKYDSIFVPEYNLGAMENPGCVTFSEDAYVHRGLATRSQLAGRANTILHEMSHMWFGDLTTPVWWDDLWLKESFAEFMGTWASATATKYTEAWVNFAGARLTWALRNDQYPTTHPIVADIPDLEAAEQAFDGITYAKGAAVLRQLVAWVGEEAFFTGASNYFANAPFSNAELADLLNVLAEASNRDLTAWSDAWLQTAGPSTISVERNDAGIKVWQSSVDHYTGSELVRPHRIEIGAFNLVDGILQRHKSVPIDLYQKAEISWAELGGEPDFILPNDGALTYAKLRFDELSLQNALAHPLADPLARAVVSNALWQLVRDAKLTPTKYLQYVLADPQLADSGLLTQRVQTAIQIVERYIPDDARQVYGEAFFRAALRAQKGAELGSDQYLIWTRALAQVGAFLPQVRAELEKLLAVTTDQDLRWQFLAALSALAAVDQQVLDAELSQTGSASDKVSHTIASAAAPGTRAKILPDILAGNGSNDHISALLAGFTQPLHQAEARAALPDYFAQLTGLWQNLSQEIAQRIIYALYPRIAGEQDLQAATTWLEENPTAPEALRKIILDCRADLAREIKVQQKFTFEDAASALELDATWGGSNG